MSTRGMSKKRTRSRAGSAAERARAISSRRDARRARRRRAVASASTRLGLAPRRQAAAMSPPTMKVSSSLRVRSHAAPSGYRPCTTARRGRSPASGHVEALVAGHRAAGTARSAPRRRGRRSTSLCGGTPTGISTTRSSPSCSRASCAQTRCPRCGGLNVPPRMPRRSVHLPAAPQRRTWPSPSTTYLNVHSSRSADRAARVELLGRVADLGAHAELAAVGEARGGVDVDAGRVDAALEGARRAGVAR